jgi:hypothetical protein
LSKRKKRNLGTLEKTRVDQGAPIFAITSIYHATLDLEFQGSSCVIINIHGCKTAFNSSSQLTLMGGPHSCPALHKLILSLLSYEYAFEAYRPQAFISPSLPPSHGLELLSHL